MRRETKEHQEREVDAILDEGFAKIRARTQPAIILQRLHNCTEKPITLKERRTTRSGKMMQQERK